MNVFDEIKFLKGEVDRLRDVAEVAAEIVRALDLGWDVDTDLEMRLRAELRAAGYSVSLKASDIPIRFDVSQEIARCAARRASGGK